jgi:hypothetical protein
LLNEYLIAVENPNILTGISEVPIASRIFNPKCMRDGTTINPPPIPK